MVVFSKLSALIIRNCWLLWEVSAASDIFNASGLLARSIFSSRLFSHQGAVKPLYWNAVCRVASRVFVGWASGCPTAFVRLFRNDLLGWVGRSRERPQTSCKMLETDFLCFRFDHLQGAADCKIKKKHGIRTLEWVWGLWKKRQYIQISIVFSVLFNPYLNVYSLNHSKVKIFIDTAVNMQRKIMK